MFGKYENILRKGFEMKGFIIGFVIGLILFQIYQEYTSVNKIFQLEGPREGYHGERGLDGRTGFSKHNPKCLKDPFSFGSNKINFIV